MDRNEILTTLGILFGKTLGQSDLVLKNETVAKDVNGWTSLNNILLIETVENHYKIKFKINEIVKFKNVGELVDSIIKKTQ